MTERSEKQGDDEPRSGGSSPFDELPKGWRAALLWLPLALAMALLWSGLPDAWGTQNISYSEFKRHLASGEVVDLVVSETEVRGHLDPRPDGSEVIGAADGEAFAFRAVRLEDPELVKQLEAAGTDYRAQRSSQFFGLLVAWMLPLLILMGVWFYMLRGGGMGLGAGRSTLGFGKSRAKLVADRDVGVDFGDVAGCDEAKAELREVVEFLAEPERFSRLGAVIPHGVLLVGAPGTGKTLLARAVAGEAKVPFYSLSGSDFVEMFVGVGAARVRDLFETAKANAPCIIFIDELDAVGRQRGLHIGNVNDERENTLNQLLVEMDGFEQNPGVIVLSATNRPDVLDGALLRPGRFDRQVVLDAPDMEGREAILRVHARGKKLADDLDLAEAARVTPGFTGADLGNAMNEAALLAARRGAAAISQSDLEEAVEKAVAGPERRSRRLDPEEKRRVAYHESGHALVSRHCEHADPIRKISVIPRGRAALGYTLQLPDHERSMLNRSELVDRLTGLLGGRCAEELVFGEPSTGAENDLQQATALARRLICQFGMGKAAGLMHCAERGPGLPMLPGTQELLQRDFSEQTAREIDLEVMELLGEAHERAREILERHRADLDRVVSALLERESLSGEQLDELLRSSPPVRPVSIPGSAGAATR